MSLYSILFLNFIFYEYCSPLEVKKLTHNIPNIGRYYTLDKTLSQS